MSKNAKINLKNRLKSLSYALRGIKLMVASQHNAQIHLIATAIVCLLGIIFGITRSEWCWIVIAVIAVWTAEALNTALEFLCDVTSSEFHPLIEKAKDLAAGAVLISAIGSIIIGLLVFGPYLMIFTK
ncbi:MAG: diacylglycerol kinase family protein [Desulfobacterales bacterium]|nr:diacylglycerol kinase family protein [Desulfobacterales bacterium]